MILPATAAANKGFCAPCHQGRGKCERCGREMHSPNAEGRFICRECLTAAKIGAMPFLSADWRKPEDVDWNRIVANYDLLGRDLLRIFAAQQGADPAYGIIFQLAQNGLLEIHINTQSGIAEIPAKMRQIANWGKELTDDGWREKVGLWYTPSWKYESLGLSLKSEFAAIDDFHYKLFEDLHSAAECGEEYDLISRGINAARLEAIDSIRRSSEYVSIPKTRDFHSYIADDDGLEYHTKKHPGE